MDLPLSAALFEEHVRRSLSTLYLVFDDTGGIVDANVCAKNLIGEPLLGRHFNTVFLDFSGSLSLEGLIENGTVPRLMSVVTRAGMPDSFYFTFVPEKGYVRALGELNYAEVEQVRTQLLDTNNELSNLGRELHKANAELRRLNEIKNEFLGMAAHDLRSPIGNIASLSELLLEDVADSLAETNLELLATIKSLSEFLLTLLENLLDLSALESGKMRLSLTPNDLSEAVEKAVAMGTLYARKKGYGYALRVPRRRCPWWRWMPSKLGRCWTTSSAMQSSFLPATRR